MAELVSVYRIQSLKTGRGPYLPLNHSSDTQCELSQRLQTAHNRSVNHPGPDSEGLYGMTSDHLCGFESIEKLEEWFAGFMPALGRARYWIVEYRVPRRRVRYGHHQLIFEPRGGSFTKVRRPH